MSGWQRVLELNPQRQIVAGSEAALCDAIRRGADLRVYTEFIVNEHIEPGSDNRELMQESIDFRVPYLLDGRWVAAVTTLRQPVQPPDGFGPRPSMSFFMYNQNGQQAVARPYLDGGPATMDFGPSAPNDWRAYPKYHEDDHWDATTNAPSSNFIYDFERYRFFVRDEWQEMYAHTADGTATGGSLGALVEAFRRGGEIKVAVSGLCDDLADDPANALSHEVFTLTGSLYYATERRLFTAAAHPLVRVKPGIPLWYSSRGWDFGWLILRSDGFVARLLVDPYTLRFRRSESRHAMRWFAR